MYIGQIEKANPTNANKPIITNRGNINVRYLIRDEVINNAIAVNSCIVNYILIVWPALLGLRQHTKLNQTLRLAREQSGPSF